MRGSDIELLRTSFRRVEQQGTVPALLFYRRLFALDPSLRPLFRGDIEAQSQKLLDLLSRAIELLERPDELTALLESLGARHVDHGVQAHHYDSVGKALIGMLQDVLDQGFTPEVEHAWMELYGVVAKIMQRGAEPTRRTVSQPKLNSVSITNSKTSAASP